MSTTAPSTPRRARQPRMPIEVRREQVLDAALRLIAEGGYPAVTMEAVARATELAKPRVYTAYHGRGALLRALLEREEQRVIAQLTDAMPAWADDTDFDETLVGAAVNLLRAVAENPTSWRLLMLPGSDAPPEVREHLSQGRRFALEQLRGLLEWGRDHRPGLAELDLDLAAYSLLAMGEQAVRLTLTRPEEFSAERYGEFALGLVRVLRRAEPPGRTGSGRAS